MLGVSLTYLPTNRPIRLRNATCIYCSAPFGRDIKPTKEHVVGRNFVPNGALGNCWNLVANACRKCNGIKAALEDDISAITMQPDLTGRYAMDDPRLREEAKRKGKGAISHRTKKPVEQSRESMSLTGSVGPGVSMTFNAMGGPQLDEERTFQLARYHIRAFFYWITFNHSTRIGRFWMGCFAPIAVIQKQDWGNPQMRGFQDLIATWDYRVHAIGADEFFKIVIRRSPDDRPLWAWALEWNCNHRLIGFFGDGNAAQAAFDQLPRLKCAVLHTGPTSFVTSRVEVALPEVEDRLFSTPDGGDATGSVANC